MLPAVVAMDMETTGLARDSHIVEIGMVGADRNFREVMFHLCRVYTDKPFEEWKEASDMSHGLREEDIATAMSIDEVSRSISPLLEDSPLLVGHNIRGYDLEIIEGTPLEPLFSPCEVFDTMSDIDYQTSYRMSLEKAARFFGTEPVGRSHSALPDARTSLRIARAYHRD